MRSSIKSKVKSAIQFSEELVNSTLAPIGRKLAKPRNVITSTEYFANAAPSAWQSSFRAAADHSPHCVEISDTFAHISLGNIPGNAGDILITHFQKVLWEQRFGHGLHWQDVYTEIVKSRSFDSLNNSKAVIIGPGGLVSGAPYPNHSGWYINFSPDELESIKPPMVIFGAGVNRWKTKRPFTEEGLRNIQKMFDKCCFVGLRETAGINFLSENLDGPAAEKMIYQPCPSLMLRFLTQERPIRESKFVSVNVAADQLEELPISAKDVAAIYNQIVLHVVERGFIPVMWCATTVDQEFAKAHFPQYETLLLSGFSGGQLPHIIRMFRFAIGTRMHSVFPFIGLGIPAVATFGFEIRSSVMRDDLELGDWLCDWSIDRDWSNTAKELKLKVDAIIDNYDSAVETTMSVSEHAWDTTQENLTTAIKKIGC